MQKKPINIISFNSQFLSNGNHNHHSKKFNNKFKKSSTTQYSTRTKQSNPQSHIQTPFYNPIGISNINNNIYLNLFNKFSSNTASLKQNMISPKDIISNRINNNQINKMRKNLYLYEIPSSSSIKAMNKSAYIQPDLFNSMNFISNPSHINIRLNLKNQFINNINNMSDYNINYGVDIAEKVKEKNNKIMQLQNDLLKSQEIIHDLNNINNKSFRSNTNYNNNINNINTNLNKSTKEKNIFTLTKSSESVDKILKTAFNEYNINFHKKKQNKIHKNNFLKKSEIFDDKKGININNIKRYKTKNNKINDALYNNYNMKNAVEKDYLRLFIPWSNFYSSKPKIKSYSNDRKNIKNKINVYFDDYTKQINTNKKQQIYINNYIFKDIKKNEINISEFKEKCDEIKQRAKYLINKYIDLVNNLTKNKTKA